LALATLPLLSLLVVCELALRAAGYAPLDKLKGTVLWQFLRPSDDPALAYELIPLARGYCFGADVEINSRGFRDREYAVPKPPGTRRIVVLGDSVTFGYDLALGDTYPERVEVQLAQQGRPVEVCNLGVTGYDTLQMARTLERIGLALEPDLVVLGYCFNDAGMASVELPQFETARRYDGPLFRSRIAQWFAERNEKRVAIRSYHEHNEEQAFRSLYQPWIDDLSGDAELAQLMRAIENGIDKSPRKPFAWSPLPWYGSPAHVGKLRHAFGELERLARAGGFPLLVLILPYLKERPCFAAHENAYLLIAGEARRRGFDVLQIAEEVRAADPLSFQVRPTDYIHYNAAGHELIAKLLAECLVARGYVE